MKQQALSKLLTFALSAAVLVRSGAAQTATGEVKLGRSYAFQAEGITGDIPVSVHLPAAGHPLSCRR
jgi:hypothetical protein